MARIVLYPMPKELDYLICWLTTDDEPITVDPGSIFHVHHGPNKMRLLFTKRFDTGALSFSERSDFWSWLALVDWHEARRLLEG
jgi:hypothetical protein